MPDDENEILESNRLEAVRRIRECEKTGQSWLALGDLALEQLPALDRRPGKLGRASCPFAVALKECDHSL